MIVVDTNILAFMTFATPYSRAVSLLHKRNPVWEAPGRWRGQFLNVVSLYYRKGLLDYEESMAALDFAERLIGPREHTLTAREVMDAIVRSNCSACDCEFVALAQKLGTKLITYQHQVIREFPAFAVTPEDFLAK